MYQLLSSTRYDQHLSSLAWNNDPAGPSPFFLLPYHFERLTEAAEQHGWEKTNQSHSYEKLKEKCIETTKDVEPSQVVKLRITLSQNGELNVTVSNVSSFLSDPVRLAYVNPAIEVPWENENIISVRLDHQSTPSSIFTRTKTTHRKLYDEARARGKISSPASEIVLFNEDSLITEASISNVCFFRDGRWLTPSVSTGCLPGVMRKWLLEKRLVDEDDEGGLTVASISDGEWVLLSNGVWGCRLGRITGEES
ncbi:hypothetical protein D9757_004718 [Collybiopsis confluens]|uniref:Aminodeoxychorismate lyase n=1 Tax=Collybiopsis confluens TaxID=2823264 RepID=A0A8H5MC22_9AGAR|nr:hypothetical protein D9757_004718 [Collybiopsis confluens]